MTVYTAYTDQRVHDRGRWFTFVPHSWIVCRDSRRAKVVEVEASRAGRTKKIHQQSLANWLRAVLCPRSGSLLLLRAKSCNAGKIWNPIAPPPTWIRETATSSTHRDSRLLASHSRMLMLVIISLGWVLCIIESSNIARSRKYLLNAYSCRCEVCGFGYCKLDKFCDQSPLAISDK